MEIKGATTIYSVITTLTATYLSNILIWECSNFSSITGSWVSASKVEPHPRTRARSFPVPKGSTPIWHWKKNGTYQYFIIISLHYYYIIITGSSTIGNSWWYNHSIIRNTTVPVYGDQVYRFLREPSLHFHHPHRPESGTGQISETASAYKPKSTLLYRSYLKPVVLKNIQIINLITCKWLKWS